jgi:hypothetical protein
MNGTYTFTLPRGFDVSEFLPARLLTRADDARWLVSTILIKMANRDTDIWGLVRLDSQVLRRVMYKHDAADIVRALERGSAIETAAYCVRGKCKGYRLAQRYLGDRCVRVPVTDPRLLERIERERQRLGAEEREARFMPIHYALQDEQRNLRITDDADAIIAGLPTHNGRGLPVNTRLCQDVLVGNIRRREFPFSVGSTRRVFNAITGLKRELRHTLRIGGEPLGSIDIRCAQLGLLGMILTQNIPPSRPKPRATYKHGAPRVPASFPCLLPPVAPALAPLARALASPDVADFCALASSGTFYERLVMLSGLERDAVKLAFLRDVLAKRGCYPSVVEQAFRVAFPCVYGFIRWVNRRDHAELIPIPFK